MIEAKHESDNGVLILRPYRVQLEVAGANLVIRHWSSL